MAADEETPSEHTNTSAPTAGDSSVLAALKAQRAQIAEEHTLDLDVPGYQGLLVLRMGVVPNRQLQAIRDRAERSKSPDAESNGNADLVITGCQDVLGRASTEDALESLGDGHGPMGLSSNLAALLQLDLASDGARGVLLALFSLAPSPELAIGVSAAQYVEWMRTGTQEIDEALLEKS
jgi:hypothetical protein